MIGNECVRMVLLTITRKVNWKNWEKYGMQNKWIFFTKEDEVSSVLKKQTCFTRCLYKEQVTGGPTEMHQKPSKPVLSRIWPFSTHSCGENCGSNPAQGPQRISYLQILLALTPGSLSWGSSAHFMPSIPPAPRRHFKEWWGWVYLGHAAATESYLPVGNKGVFSGCERCRWMEDLHPRMGEMNGTEGMGTCGQSCVEGEACGGIVFCLTGVWIQDREHSKSEIFLNNIAVNFPRVLGGF